MHLMDTSSWTLLRLPECWSLHVSTAFCAVLQGSLFGQLGTMPSAYSTLFLSGQGLAGIFAALAMLVSLASECTWGLEGGGSLSNVGKKRGCLGYGVEAEGQGPWALH